MLKYSIICRTLGYGGQKYQTLLNSIKQQTVQPTEFLVVIPHGYDLPQEQLGIETFVRCKKGMVEQRVIGIKEATGDYLLLIDDDISFPPSYVEQLLNILIENNADFISPIVQDDAERRSSRSPLIKKYLGFLSAGSYMSKKASLYALKISLLGGTIKQKPLQHGNVYLTQTGHGACALAKHSSVLALHFEQEAWLEKDCKYAYPEDQVFFYKAFCLGFKTVYAFEHPFRHQDAGSSLKNSSGEEEKKIVVKHDACRNLFIFWHRFIYKRAKGFKKVLAFLAIIWQIMFNLFLHGLYALTSKKRYSLLKACIRGYSDGFKYIQCESYCNLPPITGNSSSL